MDALGLLLAVVITAASVQDRDAARPLLWNLHRASRHIRLVWADAVYTGKLSAWAASMKMTLCIVARRQPHTFEVLPRRWVVERTFAWISKHRRTVRDYETLPASHEAMILWAMIALMTRRLTQPAELSDAHLGREPCTTPMPATRTLHPLQPRPSGQPWHAVTPNPAHPMADLDSECHVIWYTRTTAATRETWRLHEEYQLSIKALERLLRIPMLNSPSRGNTVHAAEFRRAFARR